MLAAVLCCGMAMACADDGASSEARPDNTTFQFASCYVVCVCVFICVCVCVCVSQPNWPPSCVFRCHYIAARLCAYRTQVRMGLTD